MASRLPGIIVITGLMAAGKSSVAQALAERLPRSVHLRGDVFRRMVVNGRAEMTPNPSADALKQLELRYDLTCRACEAYAGAGFAVACQDVILGGYLERVAQPFAARRPGVVVLTPDLGTVAARDRGRAKTAYGADWTPAALGHALAETPPVGLWLDSSALTLRETVDAIRGRAAETRRGLEA